MRRESVKSRIQAYFFLRETLRWLDEPVVWRDATDKPPRNCQLTS